MECKQNQCQHTNPVPYNNKFFCKLCGIHMPQDGNVAIKSAKFSFPGYINPIQNLKSQWNRSVPVAQLPQDYQRQRISLIDYMMEWSEKLGLSINSLFLAVQFLDYFVQQLSKYLHLYHKKRQTQFNLDCMEPLAQCQQLNQQNQMKESLSSANSEDILIYHMQLQISENFNWNLQYTTLIDWAETVISLGIVYEQDELSQTDAVLKEKATNIPQSQQTQQTKQENIKEQVETTPKKSTSISRNVYNKIQEQFTKLCLTLLKEGSYLDKDPSELTLSLIGCVRKICGLKTPLPKCLLELYENIQPKFQDSIADLISKQTKQPTSVVGKAFTNDLDFFSLQNYKNRVL